LGCFGKYNKLIRLIKHFCSKLAKKSKIWKNGSIRNCFGKIEKQKLKEKI